MIVINNEIVEIDYKTLTEYVLHTIGGSSHLKIQKLLYFVDGFHLAYFDKPLIGEEFEAWIHGPVVRELYDLVKDKTKLHGELNYIKREGEDSIVDRIQILSEDQLGLIDEVIEVYSKYDGLELEAMTHEQKPWKDARKGYLETERCINTIKKTSMADFFKGQLYAG